MIRIATKQDLLESFRSIDREEVQLPLSLRFPMIVRDYVAWMEPSGHRSFLVFEDQARPGEVLGVVFQRSHGGADLPASMCDWCHSVKGGGRVGLMTASASKTRRVGVTICRDLSCKETLESTPGVHDLRESLSAEQKTMRIVGRMTAFARRNLF